MEKNANGFMFTSALLQMAAEDADGITEVSFQGFRLRIFSSNLGFREADNYHI